MNSFYKKNGPVIATFFLVAIIFWLIFLIVIPQLYMLDLSFRPNLPPLLRGGPDDVYTLTHYKHFLYGSETSKDAYNYVDIGVFLDTIITAVLVTVINLCFLHSKVSNSKHSSLTSFSSSNTILDKRATALFCDQNFVCR